MSDESSIVPKPAAVWRKPVLTIVGLIVLLGMLRLGIWQLDRAQQKREIVGQLESRTEQAIAPLSSIMSSLELKNSPELSSSPEQGKSLEAAIDKNLIDGLRFRRVSLNGRYLINSDIFVDNQVVNGQVGYQVFTPFSLSQSKVTVLVARGWVPVGESRQTLPSILTDSAELSLVGRLNKPPAKPPLWNDKYSVSDGAVWQFIPISEVAKVLRSQVFPLVVELAPEASDSSALVRKWPEVNDEWVAKHQGYAFQWFTMAAAFFIACIVLLVRSSK